MTNRTAAIVFGVAGTWLIEAQASAQTAPVEIAVDGTGVGTPLKRVWPYYGFDEVNYTTTPEGRALLGTLASTNNVPVHIRSHFLLNTGDGVAGLKWGSTNAYTEDALGNPIYNWTILDGIMDTVTAAGAFPLAQIAFMPQALSARPDPYRNSTVTALDGGCFYPPRDYQKWGNLVSAWATHTKARYPNAESTWLWELWNEPNIGYWHGTVAEYNRLYDFTEAALHQVFPTAPLGGPETAGAPVFLTQFLQHCAQEVNAVSGRTGTRLDMVTFHAKGGVAITAGHVRMDMGNQLRIHRDGFNIVAGFPQFRQTPIIIGEADPDGCAACSTAEVPANAYRNSTAYGAYEVAMMKRTLELEARAGVNVRGLLTWAFTFVPEPYFSGYRELANNGIHKPVLNAFKLLGRLDGTRLPTTSNGARTLDDILTNGVRGQADIDAMATTGADGKVQVLVWNYHDDLVAVAATPVHVNVRLPASFGSRATVTHLRVDEMHGDAYTVWVAQGSPAAPSMAQRTALQQAMEPTLLQPVSTVDVVAGVVSMNFDLPRFGISLVTLQPVLAGDTDGGATDGRGDVAAEDMGPENDSNPGDGSIGADAEADRPAPVDSAPLDRAPGEDMAPPLVDAAAPPVDATSGGGVDVAMDTGRGEDARPRPTTTSGCGCRTGDAGGGTGAHQQAPSLAALALLAFASVCRRRRRGRSSGRH